MRKIALAVLIIISFILIAQPVFSANIAGNSASLITYNEIKMADSNSQSYFIKKRVIKAMMEKYNSPMIGALDDFMSTCIKYSLNCYLLPSIAILESTFGKFIYPNSYNAFGWGGGYIMFKNWGEGIDAVGRGLREHYFNKGSQTIDDIGPIYSESPTWAIRVNAIQRQFELEEKKQLYLNNDSVKL